MLCTDEPDLSLICCRCVNPFTENPRLCCDCGGCARFPAADRDCFWPEFSHPRWLCCRVLYGCGRPDPGPCA